MNFTRPANIFISPVSWLRPEQSLHTLQRTAAELHPP